jgi:hypothetical protein
VIKAQKEEGVEGMPRLSRWKWGRPEDVDNQEDVPAFIHGGAGASDVE